MISVSLSYKTYQERGSFWGSTNELARATAIKRKSLAVLGYLILASLIVLGATSPTLAIDNLTPGSQPHITHNQLPLISVSPDNESLLIGPQVEIFEDKQGSLEISDVLSPKYQAEFRRTKVDVPSFGFTSSAYWIRFTINNNHDQANEWILVADYAPLDSVELFDEEQFRAAHTNSNLGNSAPKRSGDSVKFSERDLSDRSPAFHLTFEANTTRTYYMRIQSSSSIQIPLYLWSTKAFIDRRGNELLSWGIYLGALLIAAIYNFFLFLSVKDRVYIYYVLYVVSIVSFQFSVNGLASQHLWPETPILTNYLLLFFLNSVGVFAAFFSKTFLRMETNTPFLNKVLNALLACLYANAVVVLFASYYLSLIMSIAVFLAGTLILISAGTQAWYVGYKPARIYLIAWITVLVGAFVYALKTLGIVPNTVLTEYAVTIGSATEIILLSIALGDRVNTEKEEKNKARKQLIHFQKQLMKANEDALEVSQQSDQLKREFLATMSHELRTPMNGIIGNCQLLEENLICNESQEILQSLNDSANQMMGLVNKVLNFSQLIEGKITIDQSVLHTDSIAAYIKETFSGISQSKGINFTVSVDPEVSGYYLGDKQKIQHVLHDLTENAIKFTNHGSAQVTVQLANTDHLNENQKQIMFRVKDTGVGINKKNLDMIFNMFTQGDGSFKRSYGGLGLGLAVVKKYVELLDGHISVESDIGAGTEFTLTLPLTEVIVPESLEHRDAHLLIVEDNHTNQMIMKGMLKKMGHTVKIASDGLQAIHKLEEESFDLILMDCQMPVMDGFETTRKIRAGRSAYANTPIIAVTANAMAGDRERCLSCGMDDYLAKPVKKTNLGEKINLWLQTKKVANTGSVNDRVDDDFQRQQQKQ